MGRIVALDYGTKKVGIAVTDPEQRIATALATVLSQELMPFLTKYATAEPIDKFVVGLPLQTNGQPSTTAPLADELCRALNNKFPKIPVFRVDERFTSKMALQAIAKSGLPKHKRQDKSLPDRISAVIILQTFLDQPSL